MTTNSLMRKRRERDRISFGALWSVASIMKSLMLRIAVGISERVLDSAGGVGKRCADDLSTVLPSSPPREHL